LSIDEKLKEMLISIADKIDCAFIYGSVARREEHALSDIDLMIIGEVGLIEISPILR
jgi:predicted nucleotidyltransferase